MEIQINVANKHATVVGAPTIVCGNSEYTIRFTFDDEWAAENEKTARFVFTNGDEIKYIDVEFEGTVAPVPMLSGITEVFVGVYVGNRLTTTSAAIPCVRSIRCYAST